MQRENILPSERAFAYKMKSEAMKRQGFRTDLIQKRIKEANMEQNVILLGKKSNPYPYIKGCDLYIQPSRYEGKAVILLENEVQEMFERIHILKLQIPIKLKILTGIYKYRLGINALILKKNK